MTFIALEGIDGSGKTTLSRKLRSFYLEKGEKVYLTQEPTSSMKVDENLAGSRDAGSAYELLVRFTEDRVMHSRIVKEKLDNGYVVISDRYLLSSAAYQGALIMGDYGSTAELLQFILLLSSPIEAWPDTVFLLDIDPEISLERIRARNEMSGFEDLDYLRRVRNLYLELARLLASPDEKNAQSGVGQTLWNNLKRIEIVDSSIRRKDLISRCISLLVHSD